MDATRFRLRTLFLVLTTAAVYLGLHIGPLQWAGFAESVDSMEPSVKFWLYVQLAAELPLVVIWVMAIKIVLERPGICKSFDSFATVILVIGVAWQLCGYTLAQVAVYKAGWKAGKLILSRSILHTVTELLVAACSLALLQLYRESIKNQPGQADSSEENKGARTAL